VYDIIPSITVRHRTDNLLAFSLRTANIRYQPLLITFPPAPGEETATNDQYEWMNFYEAAVLETDPMSRPSRIEAAQNAIGQRVIRTKVQDSERKEIVRTLNALSALKRDAYRNPVCRQCKDADDPVTPINGRTFIARTHWENPSYHCTRVV
jgi:hypothetical protein